MRIKISFNRGEILRMRAQERRFNVGQELRSAWLFYCTLSGEMAIDSMERIIDELEDELWMLNKALKKRPRKVLP